MENPEPSPKTQQTESEDFEQNINSLAAELNEKKQSLENIKLILKNDKGEYNKKIKNYNEVNTTVLDKEKNLENVNKKMTKVKYKKKIIISNINQDFFEHFHDSLTRLPKDVSDVVFQFLGFKKTHPMIIKRMIVDEKELINLMNFMEVFNDSDGIKNMRVSFINNLNAKNNDSSIDEITTPASLVTQIKNKYIENSHINIIYPFNNIFEYILLNEDFHNLIQEKKRIIDDIDETQLKKNAIFMSLKSLEKEILKNDNLCKGLTKHVKLINTIIEKYKQLKSKEITTENSEKLKEYEKIINNFKKFNNNLIYKKYDNMNSLTLKSEYSEEYSEMIRDSKLDDVLSPRQVKELRRYREEKNKAETSKHNETLENILMGLNRKEDEGKRNIKIKGLKQIKNKRLNSDDIDALNFSDNKSGMNSLVGTKKSSKPIEEVIIDAIDELGGGSSVERTYNDQGAAFPSPLKEMANKGATSSRSAKENDEENNRKQTNPVNIVGVKSANPGKNRNLSSVNSALKENLVDKKINFTNSAKIPSFNAHNNKISSSTSPSMDFAAVKSRPEDYKVILEEAKDKIEISNSFIVKTNIPSNNFQHNEMLESVNDEWFIAPMNKIPVRASKHISDNKNFRSKGLKNLHDYLNIKIDKEVTKNSGCCVSCV